MQYILLIYANEQHQADVKPEEFQEIMRGYHAVTQDMKDKGAYVAGDALQKVESATTVRVREGERLTTDGPFAETTEQLGGYYLLNCDNLDDALEWAARIPTAMRGSIEVRPILDMG